MNAASPIFLVIPNFIKFVTSISVLLMIGTIPTKIQAWSNANGDPKSSSPFFSEGGGDEAMSARSLSQVTLVRSLGQVTQSVHSARSVDGQSSNTAIRSLSRVTQSGHSVSWVTQSSYSARALSQVTLVRSLGQVAQSDHSVRALNQFTLARSLGQVTQPGHSVW